MAEEKPSEKGEVPSKEELLNIIEGEEQEGGEESTEQKEEVQLSEIEQEAQQEGWMPKEDWIEAGHDPKQWRPADVWKDRGEFFKTINSLKQELQLTKRQVQGAFIQGQKMAEAVYNQQLSELKSARREAMANQDIETVEKIEEKMDELKSKQNAPAPQVPQQAQNLPVPQEFNDFVDRNPWYNKDPILHYAADGIGYEFLRVNPNASPETLYRFVERKMKEKFPEIASTRKMPPSPNESGNTLRGGASTAKGGSLSALKSGMSDMERSIMKTLVSTGQFKNEEEYLKAYQTAPTRR
jgi:hypothetical protein